VFCVLVLPLYSCVPGECTVHLLHLRRRALAIRRLQRYLGLPTAFGCATKEAFEFMPNRIRNVVGTWSGREASCAGQEVLLKSVVQAVSTYPMSCFLIPKDSYHKLKLVIANYLFVLTWYPMIIRWWSGIIPHLVLWIS
jgi:hypothetical protein